MLRNYFKTAIRNFKKNKLSMFINLFGLSTAIGVSILAFLFMDFYYNRDTFHENAKQIFLIENVIAGSDSEQVWGNSPVPLGPALEADFPQIERAVRLTQGRGIMRYGDMVFTESVSFVDEGFLDMFTFPLKYGKEDALLERNGLILSEEIADKYFGNRNPVGEQVTILFNDQYKESFFIKGVTEKLPKNSSFIFHILIPFDKQLDIGVEDFNDWTQLTDATFIQLTRAADISMIKTEMSQYLNLQNEANVDRPMKDFLFDPLLSFSRNSHKISGDIVYINIYPGQILSLFFSGLFLLLLACFNYMNISVVRAARRFKEIAIRKVVGSRKHHIIVQFLGENFILCMIGLIFGVLLGHSFFVPGFNNQFGVFQLEVNILHNVRLVLFLGVLLLVTGLGAGLYPAFYISSFQPANIFRKKQKMRGNNLLTKILLTLQFIFSIGTVINGIIYIENNTYQRNRDWGYDQKQRIVVPVDGRNQWQKVRNEILRDSNVLKTAGSAHHIGRSRVRVGIEILETKYDVVEFSIGYDYVETMGLRLREGRSFKEEMKTDRDQSVIVNETFVKNMGWDDAVGKQIRYKNKPYYVIGVVEDFHYNTFMYPVEPTLLTVANEDEFNYLAVLTAPGTAVQTMDHLRDIWKTLLPDSPYLGYYQDSIFDGYNKAMVGVANCGSVTAMIALIITCMGIFGLVSSNIAKMMKEISIRKILGASNLSVAKLINKDFIKMLVIATIVSVPGSYYFLKMLMDSLWTYHKQLDVFPFIFAIGIILFSAVVTISFHLYEALTENPVNMLRDE